MQEQLQTMLEELHQAHEEHSKAKILICLYNYCMIYATGSYRGNGSDSSRACRTDRDYGDKT